MIKHQIAILLCLICAVVRGQTIDQVHISGLKKTKKSFVSRFITTRPGEALDSVKLDNDKTRIIYLEPISSVNYEVKIDSNRAQVIFHCTEFYSLLPVFSFGGINENFWLQAGATDVNLFGSNEKILLYYQYFDRHSVVLDYQKPWAGKNMNFGYGFNFTRWGTVEPLYFASGSTNYNYDNTSLGGNFYYHLNYYDQLIFNATFFEEVYQKQYPDELAEAPDFARLQKSLLKIIFRRNKVKSELFYYDGYSFQVNTEAIYPVDHAANHFYIAFAELRYFKTLQIGSLPKTNIAQRLKFGLSSNEESPFAPFVLDSYVNIRGVGNRVDRGTGTIVWNNEVRQTIYDSGLFSAQLVGYSDIGSWRNPGGGLDDLLQNRNIQWFAGAGVRLIVKPIYNAVFRVDYGKDLNHNELNGFVIGVGQYF